MASASCFVGLLMETCTDDRHEAVADNLARHLELLLDDGRDAGLVGVCDDRAHLVPKIPSSRPRARRASRSGIGFKDLDAVFGGCFSLVDLEKRHDAALFPEVGGNWLAVDVAIHGAFEQDGGNDLVAGKGRRAHDADAHGVHQAEHFLVTMVIGVGNVRGATLRCRTTALVQKVNESWRRADLVQHLRVHHRSLLIRKLAPRARVIFYLKTDRQRPIDQSTDRHRQDVGSFHALEALDLRYQKNFKKENPGLSY